MKPLHVVLLASLLALTACQTCEPLVETHIKEVPIPVPCVKQVPVKPAMVHDTLTADYPLDVLYATALSDLTKYKQYALNLEIEVNACAKLR